MTALGVLIAAGVLAFAVRSSTVQLLRGHPLSPRLTRAVAGALPAGLAATIIAPLAARGIDVPPSRLFGLVVAAIVARFTNQVLLVVAAGMTTLWLLTLFAS